MLKRKILLAEDDEDDQRFFKEFLEHRTDIVLMPIAENGEVLFEILDGIVETNNLPDLIILDQNMPKSNGLKALRLLKTNVRYAHIPVSIYSTYTDKELINNGLASGACYVIAKPVTKEGYYEMMDKLFEACTLPKQ